MRQPIKPYQLRDYVAPVDEGMMQQLPDQPAAKTALELPKYLYWSLCRPQEKN